MSLYNLNITSYIDPDVVSIIATFRSLCTCFSNTTKYPDQLLWQNYLYPILVKLSIKAKWYTGQSPLFLDSLRWQVSDNIYLKCDGCCGSSIVTEYLNYDKFNSISGVNMGANIILYNNTITTYTILNPENYIAKNRFIFDLDNGVLDANGDIVKILDIICERDCCDIEPYIQIELSYSAGYTSIPDTLWGLICDIAKQLDKSMCGNSNGCTILSNVNPSASLVEQNIDGNVWKWENPKDVDNYIDTLILESNQLLVLAIYNYVNKPVLNTFVC